MKRSAKYTLKYLTEKKKIKLDSLFDLYGHYLQKTIDLMWRKRAPTNSFITSKKIDWMNALGGQYKQVVYKQALEIVKGCKNRKGKKSKPEIKRLTICLDSRMVTAERAENSTEFDIWLRIKLPFVKKGYQQLREELLIPVKNHKHGLKYKGWRRCDSVKINKDFIWFTFEKDTPDVKEEGNVLGMDQGYKNLLTTSNGQFIGKGFDEIYKKIANKKQGSKGFKRILVERNNKIKELINKELDLSNVKVLVVEDLKNIKMNTKGKIKKMFNNKLQRWVYKQVLTKLEFKTEEEAVQFLKINPAYTSQTCSSCGFKQKQNRKAEAFLCLNCGYADHADINAAINISHMGIYSSYALQPVL